MTQQLMLSVNEASVATDCRHCEHSIVSLAASLLVSADKNHTQPH